MKKEQENTGFFESCQEVLQENPRNVEGPSLECCFSLFLLESPGAPGQKDGVHSTKDKPCLIFQLSGGYWFCKNFVMVFIPFLKSLYIKQQNQFYIDKNG